MSVAISQPSSTSVLIHEFFNAKMQLQIFNLLILTNLSLFILTFLCKTYSSSFTYFSFCFTFNIKLLAK